MAHKINRFITPRLGYWPAVRSRLLTGLITALAAAACSGGDGGDSGALTDAGASADASAPTSHVVRVVADGLWYPVTLELQHDDGFESLSVLADGEFEFTTELLTGANYRVVVDGLAVCITRSDIGIIDHEDPVVELICDRVAALANLQISGLITPDINFHPEDTSYFVDVSLLMAGARFTASAERPDEVEISVQSPIGGDIALLSGETSSPVALDLGNNLIDIAVTHESGLTRTYSVNLRRDQDIAQFVYGKASNTGELDQFGISMAISRSGDTLAVGAIGEDSIATGIDGVQTSNNQTNSGAVYVFRRQGLIWEQSASIKSSNSSLNDVFGTSVALSGDGTVLAVGARWEDSGDPGVDGNQMDNSQASSGAVYVFRYENDAWSQESYIKSSNPDFHDYFGTALALSDDGETLAVGASGEDSDSAGINGDDRNDNAIDSGAVYVFGNAHPWQQQAYIKASNVGANDQFGTSVALSADGNLLAVGAHWEDSASTGIDGDQDNDGAIDSGAVYLFSRTDMVWTQRNYIKSSNAEQRDAFGRSVALSAAGDSLAVGAEMEGSSASGIDGDQEDNQARESGAVYLFRPDALGEWQQEAYVKPSLVGQGDHFGRSVALSASGDTLIVGAPDEDSAAVGAGEPGADADAPESGSAYVFARLSDGWQQVRYVKASNTGTGDHFGECVALSGDGEVLAVSAFEESSSSRSIDGAQDNDNAPDSGAWYIFH